MHVKGDIKHSDLVLLNILYSDEETPKPSTRSQKTIATSIFVWLTCREQDKDFNVTTMSGIHVLSLGDVYLKSINLEFIIDTNCNLTIDITTIENNANDLIEFCKQIIKFLVVHSYF